MRQMIKSRIASGLVAAAYVSLLACASPTRADEKPAPKRGQDGGPAATAPSTSTSTAKKVQYTLVRYHFYRGAEAEGAAIAAIPEEAIVDRKELTREETAELVARFGHRLGGVEKPVDPKTMDEPALRAAIAEYNGLLGGAAMRRSIPDVVSRIDVTEVEVPVQP
jgi:hypothetical protein